MLSTQRIGFVGAGQAARAIAFPLVQKGILKPTQVTASSPDESYLLPWKQLGCNTTTENGETVKNSDTVVWAVKPQIFRHVVETTVPTPGSSTPMDWGRKFHISSMAGLPIDVFTETLTHYFSQIVSVSRIRAARVMPNIALKVNAGCTVYTLGQYASDNDKLVLNEIFGNGSCYQVLETQLNAYCALSASGLGFMFVMLEAMSDGAVKMGIPRDNSLKIAAQTMRGAAELYLSDLNVHPGTLKDIVCSPGGTTIAGVSQMERLGVRGALIAAIQAATEKGEELGRATEDVEH